jgi:hypothetical protein
MSEQGVWLVANIGLVGNDGAREPAFPCPS